ncbi:hypothetical protein [Caenimonas koreensis]|uniref:Uncharacterized protein n=1 Tax=Caenimonas koreensis DSM 17982 TaxID=1121255 RepID=A0A844B4K5_9BURK|nr:hypothetical protein [Caenimonas koreensis]MRD49728.1 hypothetical protein [Caenimonas koreensis DSM 17982]
MELLKSSWLVWGIVLVLVGLVIARLRAGSAKTEEAGSTLTPSQDKGSWDMTAALPMCPICESPMVLRNARRRSQQAWACPTPGCKGAD